MPKPTIAAGGRDDEIDLGPPHGQVSLAFYEAIRHRAEERLSELPRREILTAEWLLGVAFWRGLTCDQRRKAGRCVAHMQAEGVLRVTSIPKGAKTTRYYQTP